MCLGLLKLSEGWRLFTIFVTGLTVLVLPLYFLLMIFLSDFHRFISTLYGIDSWIVIQASVTFSFALSLWVFITLGRPDVKRAFNSVSHMPLET